jgi:cell division protein FtsL
MDPRPPRRWSNRAVTHEIDQHRARRLSKVFLGMILACTPFVVHLLVQNEYLRFSVRLAALREEQEQLQDEQRRLRARRAELAALERIETWATERAGMVRPLPEQSVVVPLPPRRSHAPGTSEAF